MVYQFRIISDEVKDFAREILLRGDHSFLEFHQCLQENLGYDPNQLASFFLTNHDWEKELQITLIDMMDEETEKVITMEEAFLDDHVNKEEQRMLYVFDFFSERSFFIELTDVYENVDSKALPKITFAHGDPPPQIDLGLDTLSMDDIESEEDEPYGLDDDDLSEGFNFSDSDDFE
jgi:hypothetical protein